MSSRTDFRLPGHEINPCAERKCLLSLLSAYSRQWNPRNLEAPWYQLWGHSLTVAPQPYLWYDLDDDNWPPQPHTIPGPQHLLNSHDESNMLPEDENIGNITLESITSISVPSHRNRARIPDFAITRQVSFLRRRNISQLSHLSRRVTYVGFPLLAELKSSGSRCRDINTSLLTAVVPMTLAPEQVLKQAYHLFKMYPHQESVILVAITGFWWSYMIVSREEVVELPIVEETEEGDLDQSKEKPDPSMPDQDGVHPDFAPAPPNEDESPSEDLYDEELQELLYGFRLDVIQDSDILEAKGVALHTVLSEDQMKLCEDDWSDYLLYGTAPSNQVLSLILDRLHSVVHVNYSGRMG